MRLRKGVAIATACAAVASGAVASGALGSVQSRSGSGTTIEFLSVQHANEGWPLILGTLTKEYARTHPGTTLKNTYQPQQSLFAKLQLLAAQNALPTLFNTPASDVTAQLLKSGQLLDLEPTLKQLGVYDQLTPAAIAIVKRIYGGRLAALPLEFNIEGFWYNKTIFAQNGLTPPTTWPQLVQDAATLQAKGIQPFAASGLQGWPITRLISGYLYSSLGADALQKVQSGKVKLTDPRYVAAAQAVADLGSKGYFGQGVATLDYNPAQDLFLQGKAAMFYMGSWALRDLNNTSENQIGIKNVGFFPFPKVPGGVGPSPLIPMNAGQPSSLSKKKYTPAVGSWLTYVAKNYGDRAMSKLGLVTGFKVHHMPAKISPLTKLVIGRIATVKTPVLWFEALFPTKANDTSTHDAAQLVTGQMSAKDFMSNVQGQLGS
jgi:raffinose/stachyose/melibiose transport system substrate-binding protein